MNSTRPQGPRDGSRSFRAAVAAGLLLALFATRARAGGPVLLLTGDTEGHLDPCRQCPTHQGLGGMDRRATLVAGLRRADPTLLLLDAGNALLGGQAVDSGGRATVAAYSALRYDAVNVTHRDVRLGKAATLELLRGAAFAPVSANILDDQTGQPLFRPFVVKEVAGKKVAVLGLCEPPAGMDTLPHLKRQLAGVRIAPADEAAAQWLPKASAGADVVCVLYYGTPAGLRRMRDKAAAAAAVVVAGIPEEQLPPDSAPTVVATREHGKFVTKVQLSGAAPRVEQLPLGEDVAPDESMRQVLAAYAPKPALAAVQPPPPPPATVPVPDAPAGPSPGRPEVAAGTPAPPPVMPGRAPAAQPPTVPTPPPAPPTAPPPTVAAQAPPARVKAKQPMQPRGLAGVGLTQEQVNTAIDRGAEFLWNCVKSEREKTHSALGAAGEYDLFNALALVQAGAHRKYPDFDQQLRAYLPKVHPEEMGVYGSGVLCMLLEEYGDTEFQPLLLRTARYLLEGQSAEASWQYVPKVPPEVLKDPRLERALQVWGGRPLDGSPAEQWRRTTEGDKHEGGDNSVTQYALLGLHAASRAGVEIPPDTWKRVLQLYRSRQSDNGAWGYVGPSSASTGSMTCAGIYAVALCRYHLGMTPHNEDESLERGLAWLSANFTVTGNPPSGGANHYYYLYSLERLGRTLDTEFVGDHEWYPLGAQFLVGAQKENGSWVEPGPYETRPDLITSFALLFLTRRTSSPVADRATGGNGTLKTALVEPAAPRVYFIFDCSGSMLVETSDGRPKFDGARDALEEIVAGLPQRTQVALRVYGHRKSARDAGADEDTELLVPMGPLDRAGLSAKVRKLRARGKTPLARSITESAKDLTGASAENPCAVVLITDGGEDTRPPGDPVAAAGDLARMPGITLHVVGFDIGRDDWGRQLRAIAQAGRGRYWPAADPAALRGELRAAVLRTPDSFTIFDAAGKRLRDEPFGRSVTLPEGHYTVATTFAGKPLREALWVNTGETTSVLFDAGKIDVTPPAGPVVPPPVAGGAGIKSPATGTPKFCSHCGAKLAPGAKFCTSCGAKVTP